MKLGNRFFAACVLLGVMGFALAQDAPRLKPGLWEVTNEFEGGRRGPMAMTMQMCHDEASQRAQWNPEHGMQGQRCSNLRTQREGGAFIVEADCQQGESKMFAKMTTTTQGDTGYKTEGVFTFDPPRKGREQSTMKMAGKYLGACPEGMKPGERKMQGMPGMPGMPGAPKK